MKKEIYISSFPPNFFPFVFFLLFSFLPLRVQAQLVVTDLGANPPTLLTTNLLGGGVVVSNVVYTGDASAAATFTGGNGIIGFNNGIILSTGDASCVVGPDGRTSCSSCWSLPGNAALETMAGVAPGSTHDASVLDFDFIPAGNTVSFQYVFASDEYNEYVGSFNDVFAFFVNGVNVALVPGTGTFVSIDNVNACVNPAYYINNDLVTAPLCPDPVANLNTTMNGLTTVLTASSAVNPSVTNHITMAIADMDDCALDSNVFVKALSFSVAGTPTNTPAVTPTYSPTLTPTNTPILSPTNTPNLTWTQTATITLTPTYTPTVSCDNFFVSKNVFNSSAPVSIFVCTSEYPGNFALNIYNSAGEHIRNLARTNLSGSYSQSYTWDGTNKFGNKCVSGVYILRLDLPLEIKRARIVFIH